MKPIYGRLETSMWRSYYPQSGAWVVLTCLLEDVKPTISMQSTTPSPICATIVINPMCSLPSRIYNSYYNFH